MFSKACEYGIKSMIYLARKEEKGSPIRLKDVAKEIHSPEAFTAKTLQMLTKGGLLNSSKGPTGGFELARPSKDIRLMEIVKVIDGDDIFTSCVLGLDQCSSARPCPVHHKYSPVKAEFKNIFYKTSLADVSNDVEVGKTFLSWE